MPLKNRYKNLLFASYMLWMLVAMAPLHPLKMSFSQLEHQPNGQLKITTKLFLDDLTELIQTIYRLQNVSFDGMDSAGTKALQTYYLDHLKIMQHQQDLPFTISKVKVMEDGVVLWVEASTTNAYDANKTATLKNTLFFETFPNQMNLVKFGGQELRFHLRNKQMGLHE